MMTNSDLGVQVKVNVQFVAPPDTQVAHALKLFKSPRWIQFIVQYITAQLKTVSPTSVSVLGNLENFKMERGNSSDCVVCMEPVGEDCISLPCNHQFHKACVKPWLTLHSTCPTCRHQLPTDEKNSYSVQSINTSIILPQNHSKTPTRELLGLPIGNKIVKASVNAHIKRVGRDELVDKEESKKEKPQLRRKRSRSCSEDASNNKRSTRARTDSTSNPVA